MRQPANGAVTRQVSKEGLLQGLDSDGTTAYSVGTKVPLDPDSGLRVPGSSTTVSGRADRTGWQNLGGLGVKANGECFPETAVL